MAMYELHGMETFAAYKLQSRPARFAISLAAGTRVTYPMCVRSSNKRNLGKEIEDFEVEAHLAEVIIRRPLCPWLPNHNMLGLHDQHFLRALIIVNELDYGPNSARGLRIGES